MSTVIPVWGQWLLGAAAVVGAVVYLWKTVFLPAIRAASVAEEMLPLLKEMTAEFGGKSHTFAVLEEIIAQFRTDSGSSLKDAVNRLESALKGLTADSEDNQISGHILSTKVAAVKDLSAEDRALAVQDRATMTLLVREVDRLAQAVARIERVVTPDLKEDG